MGETIQVIEEEILTLIMSTLKTSLQAALKKVQNQYDDMLPLPMPELYDYFVDPAAMKSYPGLSVSCQKNDELRTNRTSFRSRLSYSLLLVINSDHGEKKAYRYMAALKETLRKLNCVAGVVNFDSVVYFMPLSSETGWVKIAEMVMSVEKY